MFVIYDIITIINSRSFQKAFIYRYIELSIFNIMYVYTLLNNKYIRQYRFLSNT